MKRIVTVLILVLMSVGVAGCSDRSPVIEISDANVMVETDDSAFSVDSLSEYIKAYDYKDETIPFADLVISGAYDLTKIGTYPLTITATADNNTTVATIYVNVVDTTAPVFDTIENEVLIYQGTTFDPDPATNLIFAYDSYDGNVSGRITYQGAVDSSTVGTYPVVYKVSDTSGNSTQLTVDYRVTDSLDEFSMFLYKRTINFYWGDFFLTDANGQVVNYDDAVYYMFTNNGQSEFERGCGLADNTDNVQGGVQLSKLDGVIYLYEQDRVYVNNYLSTTLAKAYEKGIYLRYIAEASYGNGITVVMTTDDQFNLKRVGGKWYVDEFTLPN